jgi:nucleotide-binding universal stress UspA family protein
MNTPLIRNILLPTDFSMEAQVAFHHALKLALRLKADLDIFHVEPKNDQSDWHWGPKVVQTLINWNVLPKGSTEADLASLGMRIHRTMSGGQDAASAIYKELADIHADIVVMATHGRSGLSRWIQPSVATPVALKASVPVLLFPSTAKGWIEPDLGESRLTRILVPIDHRPHPAAAFDATTTIGRALGVTGLQISTLHIGNVHPEVDLLETDADWGVQHWTQDGIVVDQVMEMAARWEADLLVTTTEGRTNYLDGLRGSTVERLVRSSDLPMLIVPAGWGKVRS